MILILRIENGSGKHDLKSGISYTIISRAERGTRTINIFSQVRHASAPRQPLRLMETTIINFCP